MAMTYNEPTSKDYLATQVPVPDSPFERLGMAVEDLQQLQKFAQMVADRIAGSRPEEGAAKGMGVIAGGGLIDSLERSTAAILGLASTIRSDLQRIESRL